MKVNNHIKYLFIIGLSFLALFIVWQLNLAGAREAKQTYPLVANYFLTSDQNFDYNKLADYDLVILPIDTQLYNPTFSSYVRAKNPDIVILAYTPIQSVNTGSLFDSRNFNSNLNSQIKDNWWLRDSSGNIISTWPGLKNINIATDWAEWFPIFVRDVVLSTGYWDGVFYDMVDSDISWVNGGDVDLDRDGKKDDLASSGASWRAAMIKMLEKSRQLFGSEKVIIINGSSVSEYQKNINGRMFEDFPTPWQGGGQWRDSMNAAKKNLTENNYPDFIVFNGLGSEYNLQKMRFGLASSALVGVYFSYDNNIARHDAIWWYDEYNVELGNPLGAAKNLLNSKATTFENGVWRRDFENGVVIVNSTGKVQKVNLTDAVYKKISGSQDQSVNNGETINQITLNPNDGIFLLRQLQILKNSLFTNGSFVRVLDSNGATKQSSFYSYDTRFSGGDEVLIIDLDGDGETETISAGASLVSVFDNNGEKISSFNPYGVSYKNGVRIAVADFNGDGKKEIVTGTKRGGGPQIRIFSLDGSVFNKGWFAFDKKLRGGVSVAAGDLNGDGKMEIIAGAGFGQKPEVKIFDGYGKEIGKVFLAYLENFRGGVNVASGDLNGDGKSEIITGAGTPGGPHVRIFDATGKVLNKGFFAFDKNKRNGVKVSVGDIDGDGQVEIIAME